MPFRPLDELDDLEEIELPKPLPLRRICSTKACRGTARPGGRHCLACHARAVQRYRDRHAELLTTRRRDAAALRDEATRAADSARAKLATALRRGTMKQGLCQICGTTAEFMGIIEDPQQWRDVSWVCRRDRDEARERQRDRQAESLAPVNEQRGPKNEHGCLRRSSFFRRTFGLGFTSSQLEDRRASDCRLRRRST